MKTKLTLRMEEAVIEKAKVWARERGVSLSLAVSEFFSQLPEPTDEPELSPWTRRLAGAAAGPRAAPSDDGLQEEYLDRLAEKHR